MQLLASSYRVVSAAEVLEVRRGRGELPPRSVAVTFDDAYCDFAEHAWPIMRRLGLPVTLFVPTGYPDRPDRAFWWDRLYAALAGTTRNGSLETPVGRLELRSRAARGRAYRLLRDHLKSLPHAEAMAALDELSSKLEAPAPVSAVLGWEELRRLAAEGVVLAPHSRTHPLLNRVSPEERDAEIVGSREDLEREVGPAPPVFAYPAGGLCDAVVAALAKAGFELAFTTGRGTNDLSRADWLRLRRVNVGRRTTLPLIRAQLLPSLARIGGTRRGSSPTRLGSGLH